MMRIFRLKLAGYLCWSFAVSVVADDALIRKVHELELAGENSSRQAVLADLDHTGTESLHWLQGDVRVGEEWLPYRRVVDHGDRWAELHRYREERAKKGQSIDDQFFLADGCRQHKLYDEERAHLHAVLEIDGDHEEARQRMGDRKVDGVWVTSEEAQTAQRSAQLVQRSFDKWGQLVERQVKLLSERSTKRREAARAALHEIRDPDAIPVMESFLGQGNEPQQLEYLDWVSDLSSWRSSASIATLATGSNSAVVRVRASKELKGRRLEEYVPTILGSMVTPVSIRSTSQKYGNWVFYSQHAVSESQNRRFDYHYMARYSPEFRAAVIDIGKMTGINFGTRVSGVVTDSRISNTEDGVRNFSVLAERAQEEVGEKNRQIDAWNSRCDSVLSEATGVGGMSTPQDWWAWWEDDQGYLLTKSPVFAQYQEEWYVGRRRGPVRRPGTSSPYLPIITTGILLNGSCFAAGTPVMTEYGSKPIESIVLGDRVLSQDVETGELSFKPVFRTTVRISPGSAIVKTGDEQLVCTPCHPFWVNGKGWRMARELEPGDRFHSVSGSVDVTGVDAGEKVEVFNLHVGDFHTYFVGKNPVLTHDVTVRQPTDKTLPGFDGKVVAATTSP
jgi:hypothetical protein